MSDNTQDRVRTVLEAHPLVDGMELFGSRSIGDATPLSDWDYLLDVRDYGEVQARLPVIVAPLEPLGQLWDPLATQALYMLMLPGPHKIDLFFRASWEPQPPWKPSADNLITIDWHFWDWLHWLGGKSLRGDTALVNDELEKMGDYLLAPLGAPSPPKTLQQAIQTHQSMRAAREREFGVDVPRELGDQVERALRAHGVLSSDEPGESLRQ